MFGGKKKEDVIVNWWPVGPKEEVSKGATRYAARFPCKRKNPQKKHNNKRTFQQLITASPGEATRIDTAEGAVTETKVRRGGKKSGG